MLPSASKAGDPVVCSILYTCCQLEEGGGFEDILLLTNMHKCSFAGKYRNN